MGPTGATGLTGATGPTGPSGDTGQSLASANNNDTTVSGNGLLSFYQNLATNGTAITHTSGSPFFEITEPGLYEVYYQTTVGVTASSYPVTAETVIVFDGDTVPHTQDSAAISSSSDSEPLSGYAVFYASSASTLFLRNTLANTHFNNSILMVKKIS